MYSVRREPDERHTIEVVSADGERWYREQSAGLDLWRIRLKEVQAAGDTDGLGGVVVIPVQFDYCEALMEWSRTRIGNSVIFLHKGRAVGRVVLIEHEMGGLLSVRVPSFKEAERLVAELKGR